MSSVSSMLPSEVSSLVAMLADRNGSVRWKAREALVDMGQPCVSALVSALESSDAQVRWEAAKALHDIADPTAAPGLVRALEDKEFSIRWLAAEALVLIGRKSLIPLLEAMIERGHSIWLQERAHHILKSLARHGLPEPVGPVLAALEGIEPELVVPPKAKAALEALRSTR